MIWVIGGTQDGREIALAIQNRGKSKVMASVATEYGASLLRKDGVDVQEGRLNKAEMKAMIAEKGIHMIIDASHPYAQIVSQEAREAAMETGILYVRYERSKIELPKAKNIHPVKNDEEAAQLAASYAKDKGSVFLTTGSKNLPIYMATDSLRDIPIYARVLPTSSVIQSCEKLGLPPKQIIAMQGPFSYEMNQAMFKDTKAAVVVMKNSGLIGGSDAKLEAALDAGLEIIVITPLETPIHVLTVDSVESLFKLAEENKWNL